MGGANLLKVERINHGVKCRGDMKLVRSLAVEGVPLTVCSLSNVKLRHFGSMEEHNLAQLLDQVSERP